VFQFFSPAPAPVKIQQPVPQAAPEPPKDDGPKKYVPPGARSGGGLEPARLGPRRKRTSAPNLTSEEDFPTLGVGQESGAGGPWAGYVLTVVLYWEWDKSQVLEDLGQGMY